MPRGRSVLLGASALGVVVVAMLRAAAARSERGRRTAAVAGLGAKTSARYAIHRARRAFAASADAREALDMQFQLRTAAEVTEALGQMKGVLMKVGQMASFLDDGLPEPIRDALATLQQDAPPMSADLADSMIEEELGAPPRHVFAEWDPVPIAAASIGQVHRAITQDGRAVAVKVQYPGVDRAIGADLDNSNAMVSAIGAMFPAFDSRGFVEEMRERITEELDYTQEAANQRLFADYYRGHPFIEVPDVVGELSTARVLTTELATGTRFRDVAATWTQHERTLAAEAIYRFVFGSVYRLHAFNGDPHPGNYLFRPGGRVAFLDFGLVKRWSEAEVALFEEMVRTIAIDHDGDAFKAVLERGGILKPGSSLAHAEILDYFGLFYLPVMEDAPFTFTHEYSRKIVQRLMWSTGEIAKHGNVPRHSVVLQRINVGLYAILAELGATANWRRIAEELWPFCDREPTTALGEEEARWLASAAVP